MAILQVDILLKTAIEAALADLRQNPWLLDDVFGGLESDCFAKDPLAKAEYGYKEIATAKQWFLDNEIMVLLPFRTDSPEFPCITVTRGPSSEMLNRASLADDGSVEDFDTSIISTVPQRIYNAFSPKSYDPSSGTVTFPDSMVTDIMVPGQYLVSSKSGKAYQIVAVTGAHTFRIGNNISDDFNSAYVAPPIALWNLHREQTFFQETFYIGCHAQSDPVQCMWLHAVLMYIFLRYKEAYLEGRGFEVSTFSSDQMIQNPHFQPEMVFTRTLTLTGQVEGSWCKFIAPRFEATTGRIVIADGPKTPPGYVQEANLDEGIYMEADVTTEPEDTSDDTFYDPELPDDNE